MKKAIGYLILVIGVVVLALSYKVVQTSLKITLPSPLTDNILLYAGIVILLVGAYFSFRTSSSGTHKAMSEVPIYHGKEVVGYRRLHK
jgi:uncharacterized membrane protein SirB2